MPEHLLMTNVGNQKINRYNLALRTKPVKPETTQPCLVHRYVLLSFHGNKWNLCIVVVVCFKGILSSLSTQLTGLPQMCLSIPVPLIQPYILIYLGKELSKLYVKIKSMQKHSCSCMKTVSVTYPLR